MDSIMHEYRCDNCNKLLIKGILLKAYEEHKCLRCGKVVRFQGMADEHKAGRYLALASADGKITDCSQSVENILGRSPRELLGKRVGELYADEARSAEDERFASKAALMRYLRSDTVQKHKNGRAIPVRVCYRSFRMNGKMFVLRIVDMQAPRVEKDAGAFDPGNFCDLIGEVDLEGRMTYIDTRVRDWIGYEPTEIVGRPLTDFLVPGEVPWREKNRKMLFGRRESYRIPSLTFVRKDGMRVSCEASSSPMYDDLGDLVGYRALCWFKRSGA